MCGEGSCAEYTRAMSHPDKLFASLFEPRRIALIGASADVTKTTSRPQRFLRKHGFAGEILPINPSRTEILGEKAYKDLDAVTGDIDHAYILLNGKAAVDALAACGRRGVKVASILAGGFADAGAAGASMQDDLLAHRARDRRAAGRAQQHRHGQHRPGGGADRQRRLRRRQAAGPASGAW